jgi:aarF domain-containing kinase
MKKDFRSRSIKLLSLAARVGTKEVAQNLKDRFTGAVDEVTSGRLKTRIDQARLIAEQLSQLKGAAMKAGQLLSLDAADYFPPEAVEVLSKLQGKAEPIDWSIVREVLVADLGEEKIRDFKGLSIVPAASASIGQVHRARLVVDGVERDVAIKIQYPGIADSIDSDLKILKTLASSLLTVTGRRIDLDETFDELRLVLHQEANYDLERKHMEEYRGLMNSLPGFIVPQAIPAYSSKRVLTMTWEEGISLQDWLATSPPLEQRNQIGRKLLDLYCREFFDWGFVQTDPNYGNFLIRPKTLDLVVLDFGATLHYSPEFRAGYVHLLRQIGSRNPAAIIDASISFGLISDRESTETRRLLAEMMISSLEPFREGAQPFHFKNLEYVKKQRATLQEFTQSLRHSPPPKKILFLHRKLGGIFSFLKKLEAEIDVAPYWAQMLSLPTLGAQKLDD